MSSHRWIFISVLTAVTLLFLIAITLSASAFAAALPLEPSQAGTQDSGPAVPSATTTLTLSILSSPWAPLDHNDPTGNSSPAPDVLVVEASVTNTGTVAAEGVVVELNYDEDPGNNWVLLDGEDPVRTIDSIGPGETYYAYWLAAYSTSIGTSHQYTVTADASNASAVATSDNYYGNPAPGGTVLTREYRSTGSSGITAVDASFIVGVAYTLTIDYDLGNDPQGITFSPVGNSEFDASTTRLLDVSVIFSNATVTSTETIDDRIYVSSVPLLPGPSGDIVPDHASVVFRLLPLTPTNIEFCSYAAILYTSQDKYDQFFCEGDNVVPISGTVTLDLQKSAHSDTIQQDEVLTYTLHYSNTGISPLQSAWLWDDVDPAIGTIVPGSIDPPADVAASNANRVAWDLGEIAPAGEVGSSGTLTFAILVDGNGLDLADGTLIENNALFGVSPGSLPATAALTTTITTTVQAPTIVPSKSDGLDTVGNGERLTYTLNVANVGSSTATGLVVTDVLPADTTFAGPASPPADSQNSQTLVWTGGTLGDLAPGATLTITVPVSVGFDVATFTVLSNTVTAEYQNTAGYTFDPKSAGDETTVFRRAGFVDGYAFVDSDGDGQRDPGEGGLSGVAVSLPGAADPDDTSDGTGYYDFRVEFEGPISVTTGLPAGYFRTTPGTVYTNSHFAVTQTINFGYAPLTSTFGVVFGAVYEDANHDGVQGAGESGLAGVSIASPEAETTPVTTSDFGLYTLRYNVAGSASLTETNPPYFVSTTPDNLDITVALGSSNGSPYDFGDFQGIKVSGQVFEDANFNGLNDDSSGVSGATVSAGGDSHLTTASGEYTLFTQLSGSGPLQVSESDPAGYLSTAAVPGNGMSVLDNNTLQITSPISGTVYTGGDFGDVLAGAAITITGSVWEDDGAGGGGLANGQQDGAEAGLAGATVSLDTGLSDTTGSDGLFTLTAPAGRVVTLTETNPDGYVSTNAIPGNAAVRLSNDSLAIGPLGGGATSANNKFGDVLPSLVITISGYVWDDNGDGGGNAGDGVRDPGEPGLAGATVALNTGLSETTASDGYFLMHAPPDQEITLSETNPAGHVSTNAIPGNDATKVNDDAILVSALTSGSTSSDNLFGDVLSADLSVTKSGDPDPVAAGATLTYTINFTNTGPADAQSVTISDTLPAGVIFGGVVSQPGSLSGPSQSDQNLTWSATSLTAEEWDTIIFTVTVRPDAAGTLVNNVAIYGDTFDIVPGNNSDDETTSVGAGDAATIYGHVFSDANGNGLQDAGEAGIPGVLVTLDGAESTNTDADGLYYFLTDAAGVHAVVETDPPNHFSTTPNEVHVNVTLGQSYQVDFADAPDSSGFGSIIGTVFEDGNGDGIWDAAEPGIAGVTVTLDGGVATTTDIHGAYSFKVTTPVVHRVVESDPAGYFSTTPNTVTVKVRLGNDHRIDFGDAKVGAGFASIHGTVFEDLDSSGTWDAGEVGIEGVTVTLDSTDVITTDLLGRYVFSTTLTGLHTVVETDLLGYFSTTPNTVTVNVSHGNGYAIDFGDVPAGLATCPADSFEEDDSPAQAAALSVGATQAHDFCDDTTDWQKFEATASNIYTVTTSSWGQRVDTYVAIYDTDGTTRLIASDDKADSSDFSTQLIWRAPADGQYYINVTSMAGQTGFHTDYTVSISEKETSIIFLPIVVVNHAGSGTVSYVKPRVDLAKFATRLASFELEPRGVIEHSCKDAFEIDDTWQQASAIEDGVPQLHSFDSNPLIYAADKDFVWFDIGAFGTITFTVGTDTGTGTHLEVFDDRGISTGKTGTTELVFGDVPSGRYYLSVSPTSMEYGCAEEVGYTLTAERTPLLVIYLPAIFNP